MHLRVVYAVLGGEQGQEGAAQEQGASPTEDSLGLRAGGNGVAGEGETLSWPGMSSEASVMVLGVSWMGWIRR